MKMDKVKVIGSPESSDSRLVRRVLDRWDVAYEWVDVTSEPGTEVPTVITEGGRRLVRPSLRDLEIALKITPRLV
jgi:hypothetical protein